MRRILPVLSAVSLAAVLPLPSASTVAGQVAPPTLPETSRLTAGAFGASTSPRALEALLERRPGDAEVRRALAVAWLARGDTARAEETLDAGTRPPAEADDPALLLRGLVELRARSGRWDEALEAWRRIPAAERDPAVGSALLVNVGVEKLRAGRVGEAAARFRHARTLDPGDPLSWLRLADALRRGGAPAEALALYGELVSAPEPPPAVFETVGGLWVGLARPDTAAALLHRGVSLHPDQGELWRLLGRAEMERDSLESALDAWSQAAPLLERPAAALLPAARTAETLGRSEQARAALARLVTPGTPRADLLVAGHRALEAGFLRTADAAAAELLGRDGEDPEALELAARAAEAHGHRPAALDAWRRLAPRSEGLLGVARLGRLPADSVVALERRAVWAAVEELDGGEMGGGTDPRATGAAWVSEWRALRRDERRARLEELLDRTVLESPEGVGVLEALRKAWPGRTLLDRYAGERALLDGRPEEALTHLDRAAALRPDDAPHHAGRARALEALGRTVEAADAWSRAMELEPEDPEAFRALVRLRGEAGTLESLLDRVRRLRALEPGSRVLVEREVEVLQRMGRLEEARRVAEELHAMEGEG